MNGEQKCASILFIPPTYDKEIHCHLGKMHPFTKPLEKCTKTKSIKIEMVHDVKEGVSFLKRGRDFLELI